MNKIHDVDGRQISIEVPGEFDAHEHFEEFLARHKGHNFQKRFSSVGYQDVSITIKNEDGEYPIVRTHSDFEPVFINYYEIVICKDCSMGFDISRTGVL